MTDKKVAIIVSAYNGEEYIKEQIDSLLNQTYKNIDIYIRDDGSSDNTLEILKQYQKNKNVKIFEGNNIGLVNSFYECLKIAYNNSDYFAYCDQDDKWHENKIERAIKAIETRRNSKPLVYFTELNYCDINLNFIETSKLNKRGPSFKNSLMECITSGNTMVFNKQMANKILESNTRFNMFS